MEPKKLAILLVVIALLIFGPMFFLSGMMMGVYQGWIDENPNTESAKSWQLRLGLISFRSFRPELGAEMYGKFADRYPDDPRRPEALWMKGMCYEDARLRKDSKEAFIKLRQEYARTESPEIRKWVEEVDQKLKLDYNHYESD